MAIESYNLALVLDGRNIEALNGLGCAYLSKCRPKEAISHFRDSLSIRDDIDTRTYLGRAHLMMGDLDGSATQYQSILEVYPKDVLALVGVGDVHRALGCLDEAVGFYNESLEGYLSYAGYLPGRERWGIRSAKNLGIAESLGRIQAYRGLVFAYSHKGEPWNAFVAALRYKFAEAKDSLCSLLRRFSL